jgi:transposase
MKLNACRNRLLTHLPSFLKPGDAGRKITSSPERKKPFKFDARAVSRFCFQKRKLSDEELNLLCDARAEWDEFDRACPLAEEFVRIVRRQGSIDIGLWIVRAFNPGVKELESLANGLQKDLLAVKEAVATTWSNGQTEGQVNRLKLLKRQMYGQAKFDLLKAEFWFRRKL